MTLRDQLAAKQRRRVSYPVQVADPEPAQQRAAVAHQALAAAEVNGRATPDEIAALQADYDTAQADAEACFVGVDFDALPPADFEALIAAHTLEDGKDAGIDRARLMPALAAACAVDESLRDESWWAEQLDPERTSWSTGEVDALWALLFVKLHYTVPRGAVSKG